MKSDSCQSFEYSFGPGSGCRFKSGFESEFGSKHIFVSRFGSGTGLDLNADMCLNLDLNEI